MGYHRSLHFWVFRMYWKLHLKLRYEPPLPFLPLIDCWLTGTFSLIAYPQPAVKYHWIVLTEVGSWAAFWLISLLRFNFMMESEPSLYFLKRALLSLSDALEIASKVEVRKWCGRALRNACFSPIAMVSRKTLSRKFSWDPKSVWDICWISAEEAWTCAPVLEIEAHRKLCE